MPRISYRLSLVLALAACSAEPAVDAVTPGPSAEQNAYDDSDCNLQTVLDPDKPGAPGHLIESPRNPTGDSELAVLMRKMVEDLKENRLRTKGGQQVAASGRRTG